jgi:hypothetical protein
MHVSEIVKKHLATENCFSDDPVTIDHDMAAAAPAAAAAVVAARDVSGWDR